MREKRKVLSTISYCCFVGVAVLLVPMIVAEVVGGEGGGTCAMFWVVLLFPVLAFALPGATVLGLVSYLLGHDWRLLVLSIFALVFLLAWISGTLPNDRVASVVLGAYSALSVWWSLRWWNNSLAQRDGTSGSELKSAKSWLCPICGTPNGDDSPICQECAMLRT